jgi:hypothetical protein
MLRLDKDAGKSRLTQGLNERQFYSDLFKTTDLLGKYIFFKYESENVYFTLAQQNVF